MAAADAPMTADAYHNSERSDVLALLHGQFGKVLDVGGGAGATAAALKREGRAEKADLLDTFSGRVEPAIDTHLAVDLEDGALLAETLAANGPYDLMLCLDVLEHLVDPWSAVKTLRAGLADDGLLVASIPNIRHYTALRDLAWRGQWTYRDYGLLDRTHLRFFVKSTMVDLLEGAGLQVERVEPLVRCGGKMGLAHRLFGQSIEDFVALQYVLFARKG